MVEPTPASTDLVAAIERLVQAGPALEVSSDLTVTVEGTELRVTSFTDLLRVELPSMRAAVALARREGGRDRLADLGALLTAAGLTAEFVVGRTRVARVGADATPGPVARLLGLGPVEADAVGAVTALVRAP